MEALASRRFRIAVARAERPDPPLFARALGPTFAALPAPSRDLHMALDERSWSGRAIVTRGASRPARLLGALMRLPPPGRDAPITVILRRDSAAEAGRATFDLRLAPPTIGEIVRSRGWLEDDQATPAPVTP